VQNPPPWSAFRISDYGFTQMHIYNKTHIHFEQISAAKVYLQKFTTYLNAALQDAVVDSFWLQKDRHGPYGRKDEALMRRHGHYVPMDYRDPDRQSCGVHCGQQ
jgi:hypothetical protein